METAVMGQDANPADVTVVSPAVPVAVAETAAMAATEVMVARVAVVVMVGLQVKTQIIVEVAVVPAAMEVADLFLTVAVAETAVREERGFQVGHMAVPVALAVLVVKVKRMVVPVVLAETVEMAVVLLMEVMVVEAAMALTEK